jgi:hypothetical protein
MGMYATTNFKMGNSGNSTATSTCYARCVRWGGTP